MSSAVAENRRTYTVCLRLWLRTGGPIPYVFVLRTGQNLLLPFLRVVKASIPNFTQSSPLLLHVDIQTDGRRSTKDELRNKRCLRLCECV
jgi:hypothetical protein